MLGDKGPHLVTEGEILSGKIQIHCAILSAWWARARGFDAVEVFDFRAAAHAGTHLRAGGLEVFGLAVGAQGVLVGIELEHLVDLGIAAALGQLIGQIARLIGPDLLGQVGEDGFEFRILAFGHRQGGDHADHNFTPNNCLMPEVRGASPGRQAKARDDAA